MTNKIRTIIGGIAAAAMLAGTMVAAAPAEAHGHWQHYNHGHYGHYGHYGYYNDGGGYLAAGVLGFLVGSAVGSAASHPYYGGNSCYRFKTYNPSTGMYMSYNGPRHCP